MNPRHSNLSSNRSALNPLTYCCASYLVQIVMLPIVYLNFAPEIVDRVAYLQTFLISLLHALCLAVGYYLAPHFGRREAFQFLNMISLRSNDSQSSPRDRRRISIGLFLLFLGMFAVHMVVSGGGLLWITNSRLAYANYRIGVGPTYGLCIILLYLSAVYSYFTISLTQSQRRILLGILGRTGFFAFFAYFLGSKGYILGIFLCGLAFYNYNVCRVKLGTLLIFGSLALLSTFALLFLQSSASNSQEVVQYADYYHNTSEFLRRFDEFRGYRYGEVMVSDLWSYVPRALAPNKPYEYGVLLLNQLMFPGAAEIGYTPAFLPWTPSYFDFGLVGVIMSATYSGLCLGWVHAFYVSQPGVMRFLLLMNVGFVGLFPFIPLLGVLLIVFPLVCLAARTCQTVFLWLKYAALYQALSASGRLPR